MYGDAVLGPVTDPIPVMRPVAMEDPRGAVARPATPKGPPVWPVAAAVGNLSGLGVGYALLREWLRAGLAVAGSAVLVTAAFVTGAASQPWLWRGIVLVWVGLAALDGARIARRPRVAPAGMGTATAQATYAAPGQVTPGHSGHAGAGYGGAGFDGGSGGTGAGGYGPGGAVAATAAGGWRPGTTQGISATTEVDGTPADEHRATAAMPPAATGEGHPADT
ncbi:MAG TPA: hypothetical protein VGD67_16755, partial [Pseudonocardiaceae bacterium]